MTKEQEVKKPQEKLMFVDRVKPDPYEKWLDEFESFIDMCGEPRTVDSAENI